MPLPVTRINVSPKKFRFFKYKEYAAAEVGSVKIPIFYNSVITNVISLSETVNTSPFVL